MAKLRPVLGLLCALILVAPSSIRGEEKPKASRIEGAWENVTPGIPENLRHFKLITAGHFTWVLYNRDERVPKATFGGTYTIEGDTYTERAEFATAGYQHLLDKSQSLTVTIEGDRLHLTGTLTSGQKINEMWKRAKKAE